MSVIFNVMHRILKENICVVLKNDAPCILSYLRVSRVIPCLVLRLPLLFQNLPPLPGWVKFTTCSSSPAILRSVLNNISLISIRTFTQLKIPYILMISYILISFRGYLKLPLVICTFSNFTLLTL